MNAQNANGFPTINAVEDLDETLANAGPGPETITRIERQTSRVPSFTKVAAFADAAMSRVPWWATLGAGYLIGSYFARK